MSAVAKLFHPFLALIDSASEHELAKYLHPGMVIVLESTTYPGTTRDVLLPILLESGLAAGSDFFLAYSPEREDPGNPDYTASGIPNQNLLGKNCMNCHSQVHGSNHPSGSSQIR